MTDTGHSDGQSTGHDSNTPLQSIDRATLTPLVRQAVGSETVEVTSWDSQQIHGGWAFGNPGGSFIHRVSGDGRDHGNAVKWSLILKVLYPPADRGKPSDFAYWRREADAYQSGLLDDLPGGLAAPRCFGVVEHPDEACWIWMEDVRDDIGPKWPLEHFRAVAHHLGRFNGAYLTGKPLPSYPWLSSQWLRSSLARAAGALAQLHQLKEHPLVRRAYPPDEVDLLSRQWAQSEKFLDALGRLPQTLCHFDPFHRNMFARRWADGLEQTVVIDWAFVGIGAVGQDIYPLVSSTLTFREVDAAQAKELDDIVFEGYLQGLRDAGWRGDQRQVRLGQTARSTMRGLPALADLLAVFTDESRHEWLKETMGVSIEEFADRVGRPRGERPLDYWEDEAWELVDELW